MVLVDKALCDLSSSAWPGVFLSPCPLCSHSRLQRAEPRHHHRRGGSGRDHHSGVHGLWLHHWKKVECKLLLISEIAFQNYVTHYLLFIAL